MRRRLVFIGIGVMALAFVAGCSSSSKSSSSSSATTAGGGGVTVGTTAGTTVNVVVSDTKGLNGKMTMVVTPATAKAGNVTFTVKNSGTIDHEVVVLKLKSGQTATSLKITSFEGEANRVDESSSVGETGDPPLKPGETRSFTVKDMAAGAYALVCNIAKHYGLGMRAPFAVTS